MSERLKSTGNVSNEEIIEDLTKDLHTLNTHEKCEEFVIDPEHSSENIPHVEEQEDFHTDLPGSDTDPDAADSKNLDDDEMDSVEEALKDAEVTLTDDEKEERRRQAEELKSEGNKLYLDSQFEPSVEKYSQAIKICPLQFPQQRAILYCNRATARLKLERYKPAIQDCSKSIELDEKYVKAYVRRAQAYEATEKFDESLADYKKVLEFDPSHKEAVKASIRLPPLIEEKNEKLKTEMLGKLKDLGNMILKPFGLSTENFQLEQDPESKGYKINFKQ